MSGLVVVVDDRWMSRVLLSRTGCHEIGVVNVVVVVVAVAVAVVAVVAAKDSGDGGYIYI
ncbi:hypothetical protein HanRHA438_Chr10g0471351 [Helianthus annuus]|nr:hypothetical protein HanRHA438_Chr10g0471351 [Helianthus annuus]